MKTIIGNFLDQQVMPAVENSLLKWTLRGASVLYINNLENVLTPHKDTLINLGLADGNLNINYEYVKQFIETAFEAEPTLKINVLGSTISFTKEDATVLLGMMEKQNGS